MAISLPAGVLDPSLGCNYGHDVRRQVSAEGLLGKVSFLLCEMHRRRCPSALLPGDKTGCLEPRWDNEADVGKRIEPGELEMELKPSEGLRLALLLPFLWDRRCSHILSRLEP